MCLNLPSFSGGLNPWGTPNKREQQKVSSLYILLLQILHSSFDLFMFWSFLQNDWTPPYVDDALFEVVGFKDAWHGLVLLTPNGHGTRLAQVAVQL